ncbi:MAG: YHYH protein [Phycisphaerales bacterium]|nr:YHYH protein [Phycisphaerales bacterium]
MNTTQVIAVSIVSLGALSPTVLAQTSLQPVITNFKLNTTGATGYNGILADVQSVQYSTNYVYVKATNIPSYTIGPWPGNPNSVTNQNWTFKLARNPVLATTFTATPLGHIGVLRNGATFYNPSDAMSWQNLNIWHQNALVAIGGFDAQKGHPAPNSEYHAHGRPPALNAEVPSLHSRILGFAFDGFPVYGPYGYNNADGTGGVVPILTGYRTRNITQRTTLPNGTQLPPNQYGPAVSTTYPLSYFMEDHEHVASIGHLDTFNGRVSVTPDYPNGIYCYFATINTSGTTTYPYFIGPTYRGVVTAGNTGPGSGHVIITEPVVAFTGSPCDADLNGDRVVDGTDLANLLTRWGMEGGLGDVDRNGVVDGSDLAAMLSAWGTCP